MSLIELPRIDRTIEEYTIDLWMTGEVCRFYVARRRDFCTHLELLDIHLSAPVCESCAGSDPFPPTQPPDISPSTWQQDVEFEVGADVLDTVRNERRVDPGWGFICKRCAGVLRPWEGDSMYVVSYHLEDHYQFPLTQPNQIQPSRKIQRQLMELYGNRCFACGREDSLHIDHINPRINGGDSSFRNLQPLCDSCGQAKGSTIPNEVRVHDTMYFGPYPSDGNNELFW